QLECSVAERETKGSFPERLEGFGERRVRDSDCEHGREEQEEPGRRRPGGEAERGDTHLVAEGAEHGVGERAFVPRTVVAASVDEERRREAHAARSCALDVASDTRLRGSLH